MKIPNIHGFIDRRILINYIADPEIVANLLPKPFSPKLFADKAIVGICLIRLKKIKPKGLPDFIGVNFENAAHRFAVEWIEEDGSSREGVYIPRRDTNLRLNTILGGRLFPGKHNYAKFNVEESNRKYHVDYLSLDQTSISVDAEICDSFNADSVFYDLKAVSDFFSKGSVGYSPNGKNFDGLKLETYNWEVKPLRVKEVRSSFFEDKTKFPEESIKFDNAILMENIEHEWKSLKSISCL